MTKIENENLDSIYISNNNDVCVKIMDYMYKTQNDLIIKTHKKVNSEDDGVDIDYHNVVLSSDGILHILDDSIISSTIQTPQDVSGDDFNAEYESVYMSTQ